MAKKKKTFFMYSSFHRLWFTAHKNGWMKSLHVIPFIHGKSALTLQTTACIIASRPASGESRLPEIFCLLTSRSNSLASLVNGRTFWKLKAGWQESIRLGQGFSRLIFTWLTYGNISLSTKDPKPEKWRKGLG